MTKNMLRKRTVRRQRTKMILGKRLRMRKRKKETITIRK